MGAPAGERAARAPQWDAPRAMHSPAAAAAAAGQLLSPRLPLDDLSARLLRERTYTGQQQRQQALLCSRLLKILQACVGAAPQQQQQQQRRLELGVLSSLASRAAQCVEAGDAGGAAGSVLSFLKEFPSAVAAVAAAPASEQQAGSAAEGAARAVAEVAEYSKANKTANAAELRMQRHALGCVCALFRLAPQLAASGSAALTQALAVAAAAAVTLQRVLGAEPRPKTDRGLQRHMQQQQQQQQQHVIAAGLAAAQPKQLALLRSLLVAMYALFAELLRARSAAATRGSASSAAADGPDGAAAAALPGAVGESSIELLLLLLPLSLAQPSAAPTSQPLLQLRRAAAAGWGAASEAATDFASTQESDADVGMRRPAAFGPAFRDAAAPLSWRRSCPTEAPLGPPQGAPQGAPRGPSSAQLTPHSAAATTPTTDAEPGVQSVRAECLRCVEALLRLCGRALFPYWGLLLRCRAPCLPRPAAQWGFVASSAFAASPEQQGPQGPAAFHRVAGRGPSLVHLKGPQEAADSWLAQLMGADEEQQELPWAFLATADESTKVRKAALGCLCALLSAPPLRQWPESLPAVCSRCGPRALIMRTEDWRRLVGVLGFQGEALSPPAAEGKGAPGRGAPQCACCSTLPMRQQQQQSAGAGAYTSLSRTVTRVSRLAVSSLLAVVCSQLVGPQPRAPKACAACAAAASPLAASCQQPTASSGAQTAAGAAAAVGEAGGAVQRQSPRARCCPSSRTAAAQEAGGLASVGAVALRGLAEALPALPLGLLQPGVCAAALRVAQPVVLLLALTLQEQRRRQLLASESLAACCLCFGEEAGETSGPAEWSALAASAAAVARRARADGFPSVAAASAEAAACKAGGLAMKRQHLPAAADPADPTGVASPPCGQPAAEGPEPRGRFEGFALQVLAGGIWALRHAGSCLAMVAAVLSRRQRLPQLAEALLLPVGRSQAVAGPTCLAALTCEALASLLPLLAPNSVACSSFAKPCLHQQTVSCEGAPGAEAAGEDGPAGGCLGDRGREPPRCSSCERLGWGLVEGLFSVLQAVAKRYPQALLLLQHRGPRAAGAAADLTAGGGSNAAFRKEAASDGAAQGPLVEVLSAALCFPSATVRCRGAAVALDVLGPSPALVEADRQVGLPSCADAGVPQGAPRLSTAGAVMQATREAIVALLHAALLAPLLPEGPLLLEGPLLRGSCGQADALADAIRGGPPTGGAGEEAVLCRARQPQPSGSLCEGPPPAQAKLAPEPPSLACSLLCRLTAEEWRQLRLMDARTLDALCCLALPKQQRSVRLAAAAALGVFAAQALQTEPEAVSSLPAGGRVATAARATAAAADGGDKGEPQACGESEDRGVRKALLCLLSLLADPLPDVRAAGICALCEVAGKMQQLLQQQHQRTAACLLGGGPSALRLWRTALAAINDALQSGEKAAVAAAGLRAVGAVVPLLLLLSQQQQVEAATAGQRARQPQVSSGGAGGRGQEEAVAAARLAAAAREGGAGLEVLRSLALLQSAFPSFAAADEGDSQAEAADPSQEASRPSRGSSTRPATPRAGEGRDATGREAAAAVPGLRKLKLHWNACHSVRLIFCCSAASPLLLHDSSSRALVGSLLLSVCGCLRTSQLVKVRCHAAAALAAILQLLLRSCAQRESAGNLLQLERLGCEVGLLTEAWRAVEAAALKAAPPTHPDDNGGRPDSRSMLQSYRESLRLNLESLVATGLLALTQKCLDASRQQATPNDRGFEPPQQAAKAGAADAGKAAASPTDGSNCSAARGQSSLEEAAVEALRQAMERALQAGSFQSVKS
ncbi:hypothetical protein Efla_004995 [Eimeria flavescens]